MASKLTSLRLTDMNDRELLALVDQEADYEGWVTTDHMVRTIRMGGDKARGSVSQRLSWMRRFGAVEKRVEKGETKWRLTQEGQAMMRGRLNATQQRALDTLGDDTMLYLSEAISDRYMHVGPVHATLARRMMQYGIERRKQGLR